MFASRKRVNRAEANASAFVRWIPVFPAWPANHNAILAFLVSIGPSFEKALSHPPSRSQQSTLSDSLGGRGHVGYAMVANGPAISDSTWG